MTTEAETAHICARAAKRASKRLTPVEKKTRALNRLAKRMAIREARRDYIELCEALDAKRESEVKGRFGRGESVMDDRVTHGAISTCDRQYHGYRNALDVDDDGDVDAWRQAD